MSADKKRELDNIEALICGYENTVDRPVPSGEPDTVNHPPHYTQGTIECIDYIIDKGMNYLEGNIIKYVTRYKDKNGVEDLKKARWYVDRLIHEQIKKGEGK